MQPVALAHPLVEHNNAGLSPLQRSFVRFRHTIWFENPLPSIVPLLECCHVTWLKPLLYTAENDIYLCHRSRVISNLRVTASKQADIVSISVSDTCKTIQAPHEMRVTHERVKVTHRAVPVTGLDAVCHVRFWV
jgi:hypothetical protein